MLNVRRTLATIVILVAAAACSGSSPKQVLSGVDSVLNAACSALTALPDEVEVCEGIAGAESLADIIETYLNAAPSPGLTAAVAAYKAHAVSPSTRVRVKGLPVFAPKVIADALNEPAENAKLIAYVYTELAKAIPVNTPADGGK